MANVSQAVVNPAFYSVAVKPQALWTVSEREQMQVETPPAVEQVESKPEVEPSQVEAGTVSKDSSGADEASEKSEPVKRRGRPRKND